VNLAESCVVVTGGASGLGASTVTELRRRGAIVCVWDFNADAVNKVCSGDEGCLAVACDVCSEESVAGAVEQSVAFAARAGRAVRGLVHCAGVSHAEAAVSRKGLRPHALASFERVLRVNVVGTMSVATRCAAAMAGNEPLGADGERGAIVTVASIAGLEGQDGQTAYASSKAAVIGLTLPLARDLGKFGVRVVCAAPGTFETPMMAKAPAAVREGLTRSQAFPNQRFGRPDEFAHAAVCALENGFLNGSVIRIDGGNRMAKL